MAPTNSQERQTKTATSFNILINPMPVIEMHICFFCEKRMTINYCQDCDVIKRHQCYSFDRSYKGKTYRFEYDIGEQKFIITNEDAKGKTFWDSQRVVMESDDLYLITPQNWEKKLPTILVFS